MISSAKRFSDSHTNLARRLKALAHPARLAIVEILAARDECVCGDIVDELPLAQSTVSQHLKALKEAGIVQGTIDGRRTCYCLDPEVLNTLRENWTTFFDDLPLPSTSCYPPPERNDFFQRRLRNRYSHEF